MRSTCGTYQLLTYTDYKCMISSDYYGPQFSAENFTIFRRPAREILRFTAAKSSKFRGSLLPSICDWKLKTERAVQKLRLLKASIVLSYVSNIKTKSSSLFSQKYNETHDSWRESTEKSDWWLMFKMSVILNLSVSTEQPKCSDVRKCKWQEIWLITVITNQSVVSMFVV